MAGAVTTPIMGAFVDQGDVDQCRCGAEGLASRRWDPSQNVRPMTFLQNPQDGLFAGAGTPGLGTLAV